jgi:hypothetical protein
MRDYGKVYSRIWESPDFRGLSEDGRTLALYLLTCQHGTIAGAFRVPDGYACEDLQWCSERVSEGFSNLAEKGFATRCEVSKWVWIGRYLLWNPPENPNQRKSIAKVADLVPDQCTWKPAFMRVCGPLMRLERAPFEAPKGDPSETLPEPFRNQEQEQEQEQEIEYSNLTVAPARPLDDAAGPPPAKLSLVPPSPPEQATPPEPGKRPARKAKTLPDCPHLDVLALWAEVLPAMPQHSPEHWTGARADHLRTRWRETAALKGWAQPGDGLQYLRKLFGYVGQSPFLTGRTKSRDPLKRPFVIELEWLVLPSNWAKVHEGKYHTTEAA